MRVASEAVFAAKLAAAKRIDAELKHIFPLGEGLVQQRPGLDGLELDEVAVVGMGGLGRQPGYTCQRRLQDGEKCLSCRTLDFRHIFASVEARLGQPGSSVKCEFLRWKNLWLCRVVLLGLFVLPHLSPRHVAMDKPHSQLFAR